MELFDTYFVWFGQVLAVSGMKTLVISLRVVVFVLYPVIVMWGDNVKKKVGFHGNTPPSRKQRLLIKTSSTIF